MKIASARAFDCRSYAQANPDLKVYGLSQIKHALRYAQTDNRDINQSPFNTWILNDLLDGRISARAVRSVIKIQENETEEAFDEIVKNLCTKFDLSYPAYRACKFYQRGDYRNVFEIVRNMPYEQSFFWIELLARRHFYTDDLMDVYHWARSQLKKELRFSEGFMIAVRNIGDAVSMSEGEKSDFYDLLVRAAFRTPLSGTETYWKRLWKLGLPMLDEPNGLSHEAIRRLGKSVTSSFEPVLPPYPLASLHSVLLAAAAYNSISESKCSVVLEKGCWKIDSSASNTAKSLTVRIPAQGYWEQSTHSDIHQSIIEAFIFATKQAMSIGAHIVPLSASFMYDRRGIKNDPPALSYHTISRDDDCSIHLKESALPGYFTLSRSGFSGWLGYSLPAEGIQQDVADSFFQTLRRQYVDAKITKYAQVETDEPLPERYVFVALQLPTDSVAQLAYFDIKAAVSALAQTYRDGETKIVIKRHPHDKSQQTDKWINDLLTRNHNVIETRAPVHSLLQNATAVVVVNSGVGFEALLHLKPVITIGKSEYECATFVAQKSDDMIRWLAQIERGEVDVDQCRVKSFLYDFLNNHCFQIGRMPEKFGTILEEIWQSR